MLIDMSEQAVGSSKVDRKRARYQAPSSYDKMEVGELLSYSGRSISAQGDLFKLASEGRSTVYLAGDVSILKRPAISVIGARSVSTKGRERANRIAQQLASTGVVVTSGLAKGVDAAAHRGAISVGGSTTAVIGTPLDRAYPAENASLQEEIYRDHLLVSQFQAGQRTFPSDFPKRNRLMAALSDGSVIVEASDTSGTLHQAAECIRLGRWLFIMKSVVDDRKLEWPRRFLKEDKAVVLSNVDDILSRL